MLDILQQRCIAITCNFAKILFIQMVAVSDPAIVSYSFYYLILISLIQKAKQWIMKYAIEYRYVALQLLVVSIISFRILIQQFVFGFSLLMKLSVCRFGELKICLVFIFITILLGFHFWGRVPKPMSLSKASHITVRTNTESF